MLFLVSDKLDFKRRRTERIRRERIGSPLTSDMENRRRPRVNSQSEAIRRSRGRPKTVGPKKQEEEKGKKCSYHRLNLKFINAAIVMLKMLKIHKGCSLRKIIKQSLKTNILYTVHVI